MNIVEVYGISDTQKAAAAFVCNHLETMLFITYNDLLSRKNCEDISFDADSNFNARQELVFHRIDARSNEILQNRLKAYDDIMQRELYRLHFHRALLARTVSPELASMVGVSVGKLSLDEIKEYFIKGRI